MAISWGVIVVHVGCSGVGDFEHSSGILIVVTLSEIVSSSLVIFGTLRELGKL